MSEIHGRGGRVITINENTAGDLSTALNSLPHYRERNATQPIVPVAPAALSRWEQVLDWVDVHGILLASCVGAAGLLALFAVPILGGAK